MSDNYSPALGGDLTEDPKPKRKHAWRKRPRSLGALVGIDMSQEEYEQHREQWLNDHPGYYYGQGQIIAMSEIPPIIRASISGVDVKLDDFRPSTWASNVMHRVGDTFYFESWPTKDDEEAKNE